MRRALGLVAGSLAVVALYAPATGVAADEAAWMFDPDAVVEIDLGGLSAEEIDALEAEPDEYQRGTFELRVGGVAQGPPLGEVGIRLKGGIGSFRPLTEKAAFKVKFDEYVDDQTLFGLERLTLNNMVQDPSMVHETLTYELFRAMGLPASRTGYAFVRLNGTAYGLYLNLETLDEISLPRWFASTGHLYEADQAGVDVKPGDAGAFEVDRGDDEDLGDLEALIAAANGGVGDWSDGLSGIADLEQMTRMWAVERYSGHFDGYAGAVGSRPNNYYLHSDAEGLFTMLPWGTDQTWGLRVGLGGVGFGARTGGVLFTSCLTDMSCCAEMYAGALEEVQETVGTLDLDSRAGGLAEMLAPYQDLEAEPRRPYTAAEIAAGVSATRAMIADRPGELSAWLAAAELSSTGSPPGPCSPSPDGPGDQPGSPVGEGDSVGGPGATPPDSPSLRPAVRIGSVRFDGSLVSTSVEVAGAGAVAKRVVARVGGGWRAACADRASSGRADRMKLRCRLARGVRRELASTPLRLRIEVAFRPVVGLPSSTTRLLTAPKARAS